MISMKTECAIVLSPTKLTPSTVVFPSSSGRRPSLVQKNRPESRESKPCRRREDRRFSTDVKSKRERRSSERKCRLRGRLKKKRRRRLLRLSRLRTLERLVSVELEPVEAVVERDSSAIRMLRNSMMTIKRTLIRLMLNSRTLRLVPLVTPKPMLKQKTRKLKSQHRLTIHRQLKMLVRENSEEGAVVAHVDSAVDVVREAEAVVAAEANRLSTWSTRQNLTKRQQLQLHKRM